jgi:hypothetical protein
MYYVMKNVGGNFNIGPIDIVMKLNVLEEMIVSKILSDGRNTPLISSVFLGGES